MKARMVEYGAYEMSGVFKPTWNAPIPSYGEALRIGEAISPPD